MISLEPSAKIPWLSRDVRTSGIWLFRFFKFKIIWWDLSFLGQPKTEEMNSLGSWVVSAITIFSSKMEISEVVITDPTKPVTCNEFSFKVKCSFIFCWAPPFSSTVFASIWAGTDLCLKKACPVSGTKKGWRKSWSCCCGWAWSLSSNNKVVTSVWEEHKKPYFLFKFGLMASCPRNDSSWFVCPNSVITSIWLVSVAAVSNLPPLAPLVQKSIKFWADWAITALTD